MQTVFWSLTRQMCPDVSGTDWVPKMATANKKMKVQFEWANHYRGFLYPTL